MAYDVPSEMPVKEDSVGQADRNRSAFLRLPLDLMSRLWVARLLSVGRTKVYDLIRKEGLPTVQVGSAMRISIADLQTWIHEHSRQAS